MKRTDRIKLDFTRNWKFPGKLRLSNWFKPSAQLKTDLQNSLTWLADEDVAIYTNTDNYIEWSILSGGTYEDDIRKLIRISLKDGSVALDIGANIGLQSIRMAQAVGPTGMVYAFEPLNFLQQKFNNNIRLNKLSNIKLFPFALSNTEAETALKFEEHTWNQGNFTIGDQNKGSETQVVTIKIADDVPEIKDLHRLDLVKIDVEGFEYPVLQGLKNSIEKHKPRIIFEYDNIYWSKNGQSITDCYNSLTKLNYTIYQITSVGCELVHDPGLIENGNLFCLNAEI